MRKGVWSAAAVRTRSVIWARARSMPCIVAAAMSGATPAVREFFEQGACKGLGPAGKLSGGTCLGNPAKANSEPPHRYEKNPPLPAGSTTRGVTRLVLLRRCGPPSHRSAWGAGGSAVVRRLAVRSDVQAFAFVFFRDTQAHREVNDLVGDEGDHTRPHDGQQHSLGLRPHLCGDGVVGSSDHRSSHPVG